MSTLTMLGVSSLLYGSPPEPPLRGILAAGGNSILQPDTVIDESHQDQMTITDHPVEQGATISDHAYRRPYECTVVWGWSASGGTIDGGALTQVLSTFMPSSRPASFLKDTYKTLLDLFNARTLFTLYTAKRVYSNMLIQTLAQTTDRQTENSMVMRISCREILLATTSTVQIAPTAQPGIYSTTQNNGTSNLQPATNVNVDAANAAAGLAPGY